MEEKVNIEEFIEEMIKVRPEVLTEEAKKLFKTINMIIDENLFLKEALKGKCEVADERNNLLIENQKLNKVIDEMAKFMSYDYCVLAEENCEISKATPEKCVGCIKRFFMKKVEENEQ